MQRTAWAVLNIIVLFMGQIKTNYYINIISNISVNIAQGWGPDFGQSVDRVSLSRFDAGRGDRQLDQAFDGLARGQAERLLRYPSQHGLRDRGRS